MDYEKLHKDTIAKLQEMVNSGKITVETACGICADFVPESEDERIRKALIIYHSSTGSTHVLDKFTSKQICDWLEKQGEQKPAEWHREDEQNLNACLGYILDEFLRRWLTDIIHVKYDKLGDKVESKFKVKYAGSEYNVLDIKDIAGVTYYEIEDEPNHIDYVLPNHCKIVSEHKSSWSEEDERLRRKLIELIYAASYCDERENLSDWLKSLKDRYTWKPSDEQMHAFEQVYDWYNNNFAPSETLISLYKDLKKLKEE